MVPGERMVASVEVMAVRLEGIGGWTKNQLGGINRHVITSMVELPRLLAPAVPFGFME